jgi:hypothetical protein
MDWIGDLIGWVPAIFGIIAIAWLILRAKGARQDRILLERGARAEATVIDARDTGVTVNNEPLIDLHLEIRPQEGEPFRTQKRIVVSKLQMGAFYAGMCIHVRFDPRKPRRVAIET